MEEAKVQLVSGGRGASLLFPYAVQYNGCKDFPAGWVTLPAKFTCDFASVPRILWSFIPPQGDYTYAAMLHDFFYKHHKYPATGNWSIDRKMADKIFYLSMRAYGVSWLKAKLMYTAVRLCGARSWKK